MSILILCFLTFIVSFVGTYLFRVSSISNFVLAKPNIRSLHEKPTKSGGGIIFSLVFAITVICLGIFGILSSDSTIAFGIGGSLAALFGFADDVLDIRAVVKLAFQCCLVVGVLVVFDGGPLVKMGLVPFWLAWTLSGFLMLWLINAYNFIDGIDGMASSGAVFICITLLLTLIPTEKESDITILLCLLATNCFAFLLFNWPPATVFMGDSGSVFLGYLFGALIVFSTMNSSINFWTWVIVFGYILGDTTATIIIRMFRVKNWFRAHKSHAYQNLARIWGSHLKVTAGVLVFHLLWLLPLAVWSSYDSRMAPLAATLALVPSFIWTIRFGPLLSSA